MSESLTDIIDIRVNSLQVSIEDHERVITNKNIRQSAAVSIKQRKAVSKTKGAIHQTRGKFAAEPVRTPPESCVKDKVVKPREQQLPVSKTSEPASAFSSCDVTRTSGLNLLTIFPRTHLV